MDFVLTGVTNRNNIREFAFVRVDKNHNRVPFRVDADLTLVHRYAIPLQELPLLCRRLLEAQADDATAQAIRLTEEKMSARATQRTLELAAAKNARKTPRRTSAKSIQNQ